MKVGKICRSFVPLANKSGVLLCTVRVPAYEEVEGIKCSRNMKRLGSVLERIGITSASVHPRRAYKYWQENLYRCVYFPCSYFMRRAANKTREIQLENFAFNVMYSVPNWLVQECSTRCSETLGNLFPVRTLRATISYIRETRLLKKRKTIYQISLEDSWRIGK